MAAQSSSSAKPIATVLFHIQSPPFRAIPSPFQNASNLVRTVPPHVLSKLLRNNSCRLYVFPTQFIVFPNYSFASQFYAIPMLLSAFRIVSSPAHYLSLLIHSITALCSSAPFHYFSLRLHSITKLCCTSLCHRRSTHFLSLPLSIYQTSRLSRSCCNRVSDSLAVCSSRQGNLCSRC